MEKELRKTGIDIIGDVPWGTHFCLFYKTKKDLIDILVPFFKAGLENNEFCIWITSEPLSVKETQEAMRKALPDSDRYFKRGQMEILPHTGWYLKDGTFNLKRVFNSWFDKLGQALSKGCDGVRITGDTAWLEKKDWKNFADYEERANNAIGKNRLIAVCTYPLNKCGAFEVIDVVSNHGFALIKHQGKWEIIESAKYKQAKEVLKQKVKEATHQLREQHRAQQDFFIDLAHELKTPLTVMKGSFDLTLGKGAEMVRKSPQSFRQFLIAQKEEVDRIEKIINDLSTLAKAETNQLILQSQKIRLDELIKGVCLRLQHLAEQEKKRLEIKKFIPAAIIGDRERLEQLISNLLDNAIKFTKTGSGRVQVSLTTDRNRAKIQIKDNGIGIPKKDVPHIFKRFYRGVNGKRFPQLKGVGLGLAICQWIVKEHGGEITVKSKGGEGTIFTILLPLNSMNTP